MGGWAERFGEVTVINGPIYSNGSLTLRNGTSIPSMDFSVIIKREGALYQALAFEIPNSGNPQGPLNRYLVPIKQVEDDAGLDLFAGEAEPLRGALETVSTSSVWPSYDL